MEIGLVVAEGVFDVIQTAIFGAVVVACVYFVTKHKSVKAKEVVAVAAQQEDDEDEMIDLITGEVLKKGKKKNV